MMIIQILFISSLGFSGLDFNVDSCHAQLKASKWPTDCLLGLKNSNVRTSSSQHSKLNSWCLLKSDELLKSDLPSIFLSLSPPHHCKRLAEQKLKQLETLLILEGEFLNSFL